LQADIWDRHAIPLLDLDGGKFAHELRECARYCMWDRASKRRKDVQGLGMGVDIEATTQLLGSSSAPLACVGMLRSILAGAIVTGHRVHKAGLAHTGLCQFQKPLTISSGNVLHGLMSEPSIPLLLLLGEPIGLPACPAVAFCVMLRLSRSMMCHHPLVTMPCRCLTGSHLFCIWTSVDLMAGLRYILTGQV
jgi:hypothetical protein